MWGGVGWGKTVLIMSEKMKICVISNRRATPKKGVSHTKLTLIVD